MSLAAPDYTKSVTRNDYEEQPRSGGLLRMLITPWHRGGNHLDPLPDDLPARAWSNGTDEIMLDASRYESLWGCAVAAGIAQSVGVEFEINGGRNNKIKYQTLLRFADGGKGWKQSFLPRTKTAYLCTNLGYVIELQRSSRAFPSAITGLFALDPTQCTPTGDPDFPIIYTDLRGYEHVMPWYTVVNTAHMPSVKAKDKGIGQCAASLAWSEITKLAVAERYIYEKISGKGHTAIHFIQGFDDQTLEDMVATSKIEAEQQRVDQGRVFAYEYYGSLLAATFRDVNVATIQLKGFPDGWEHQQVRANALLTYANAIGLDPQVLAPLVGGELGGTSRQSETLREYRQQRTGVSFDEAFTHDFNDRIIPNDNEFYFVTVDINWRIKEAEAKKAELEVITGALTAGLLTTDEAQAMAADQDIIAKEYVPADQRPQDGLSEDEKQIDMPEQNNQPTTPEQEPAQNTRETTKADDDPWKVLEGLIGSVDYPATKADEADLDALVDSELAGALEWAKQVST